MEDVSESVKVESDGEGEDSRRRGWLGRLGRQRQTEGGGKGVSRRGFLKIAGATAVVAVRELAPGWVKKAAEAGEGRETEVFDRNEWITYLDLGVAECVASALGEVQEVDEDNIDMERIDRDEDYAVSVLAKRLGSIFGDHAGLVAGASEEALVDQGFERIVDEEPRVLSAEQAMSGFEKGRDELGNLTVSFEMKAGDLLRVVEQGGDETPFLVMALQAGRTEIKLVTNRLVTPEERFPYSYEVDGKSYYSERSMHQETTGAIPLSEFNRGKEASPREEAEEVDASFSESRDSGLGDWYYDDVINPEPGDVGYLDYLARSPNLTADEYDQLVERNYSVENDYDWSEQLGSYMRKPDRSDPDVSRWQESLDEQNRPVYGGLSVKERVNFDDLLTEEEFAALEPEVKGVDYPVIEINEAYSPEKAEESLGELFEVARRLPERTILAAGGNYNSHFRAVLERMIASGVVKPENVQLVGIYSSGEVVSDSDDIYLPYSRQRGLTSSSQGVGYLSGWLAAEMIKRGVEVDEVNSEEVERILEEESEMRPLGVDNGAGGEELVDVRVLKLR